MRPEAEDVVLPTTIASVIREAAQDTPDAVAIVDGDGDATTRRRWTFAELLARAEGVAGELARHLAPGERLALWAGTNPECWMVVYGAALAGLVLVPVNPGLRRSEVEHVLRNSQAAGVVVGEPYRGNELEAVLAEARPNLPDLRTTFRLGPLTQIQPGAASVVLPEVAPEDLALIVYTSGTTGTPKGAELRHVGVTNSGRFGALRFGMQPGDVYVDPLPISHAGGLVVGIAMAQRRTTMVLVGSVDAGVVLDLIEGERASLVVAVPTVLRDLFEHPAFDPARLRTLHRDLDGRECGSGRARTARACRAGCHGDDRLRSDRVHRLCVTDPPGRLARRHRGNVGTAVAGYRRASRRSRDL